MMNNDETEVFNALLDKIVELTVQRDELLAARAKRLDQERRYLASFHGADKVGGTATLLKVWIAEDEAAIECTEKG